MFIDSQLLLSEEQSLTTTAASTNKIDLGVDQDIGRGEPMAVVVAVNVAADIADGSETYAFAVRTDDNGAMSSPTTIFSQTIAGAKLTAGSRHVFPIGYSNERYIDLNYTLGGTTPSVTVTAFLQPMSMVASEDAVYANSYTIE